MPQKIIVGVIKGVSLFPFARQERRARVGEPPWRLEGEEAREPGGEARAEGGQDAGHRHRRIHRLLAPLLRPRPHDGSLHGRSIGYHTVSGPC